MRTYECVVVFDGHISEDQYKVEQERVSQVISKRGGEIVRLDPWGKRRLAYEISRRVEGYYTVFYFTCGESKDLLKELERHCLIEESILRHTICLEVKSEFAKARAEQLEKAGAGEITPLEETEDTENPAEESAAVEESEDDAAMEEPGEESAGDAPASDLALE